MRRSRWSAATLVLLACTVSCSRFRASDPAPVVVVVPQPPPPAPVASADGFAGLRQLSPLADGFQVAWDPIGDATGVDLNYQYQVFADTTGAGLDFTQPTLVTAPGDSQATLRGLAAGTAYRCAVRAVAITPTGPEDRDTNELSLDGVVAPRWYVDAGAGPGGDGTSPGRAFSSLAAAVVAVLQSGQPGNVLVAEGLYQEQLALLGDMHFFGGYASGFGSRDRAQHAAVVQPAAGGSLAVRILASQKPTYLDGIEISGGNGSVRNGLDVREADLQLSNSSLFGFLQEGLTASSGGRRSVFRLHRVQVVDNGTEGVESAGSFDAVLSSCQFSRNGNEGVEFDDLTVQPDDQAWLWIRDCTFAQNGLDGLDVDLDELDPLVGGTSNNGQLEVLVERSTAEDNGQWGFLLDVDFQDADDMELDAVVHSCTARRNRNDGILLDADARVFFLAFGNRTAANRGHGLSVTSDATATVLVTNHWDLGAGGDGIHATGPTAVLIDHAAVTGAAGLAVGGNDAALVVNSAFWLSGDPQQVDLAYSYWDGALLPGPGNQTGLPQAAVAPFDAFHLAQAGTVSDVPIPPGATVDPGDTLELGDDGVARTVDAVANGRASFQPPLAVPPPAGTFVARFATADVTEDPRLLTPSPWRDAGDPLYLDADQSPTDLGILGGTLESFRPTRSGGWIPFVVDEVSPPPGPQAGPVSVLEVGMTEPVDPATVDAASFVVLLDGNPVSGTTAVVSGDIRFTPDVPLAGGTVEVQAHRQLQSQTGATLLVPLRARLVVP